MPKAGFFFFLFLWVLHYSREDSKYGAFYFWRLLTGQQISWLQNAGARLGEKVSKKHCHVNPQALSTWKLYPHFFLIAHCFCLGLVLEILRYEYRKKCAFRLICILHLLRGNVAGFQVTLTQKQNYMAGNASAFNLKKINWS